jgi:hypothetical protein
VVEVYTSLPAERERRALKQVVVRRGQHQAIWRDDAEHTPSDCEPRITESFGAKAYHSD